MVNNYCWGVEQVEIGGAAKIIMCKEGSGEFNLAFKGETAEIWVSF